MPHLVPPAFSTDGDLFDVVDENDCVVEQLPRREVHRRRLFHRSVHVLVFDASGRIFLQRRSRLKDTCPLLWTTSCSGHVDAGETYELAVVRELSEELGIQVASVDDLQFLFGHRPCRETGQEFIKVYRLTWDGPMQLQPEEIEEGKHLTTEALNEWIHRAPEDFAPSLKLIWKLATQRASAPAPELG